MFTVIPRANTKITKERETRTFLKIHLKISINTKESINGGRKNA